MKIKRRTIAFLAATALLLSVALPVGASGFTIPTPPPFPTPPTYRPTPPAAPTPPPTHTCVMGGVVITIPVVMGCPPAAPTPPTTPTPNQPGVPGTPPTFAGSSTNPPVCTTGDTVKLPANLHVIRKGNQATVNFFITEGDSANIYYRIVGQKNWQYSVINVKPNSDNFVSYVISGLDPKLGYDFGVQQKLGCGSGQLITAVVVDGPITHTFSFTYWEWSK